MPIFKAAPSGFPSGDSDCRVTFQNSFTAHLDARYNVHDDASCSRGATDILGDPGVELREITHPVHTMRARPQAGSPAIDAWVDQCIDDTSALLQLDLLGPRRVGGVPFAGNGMLPGHCDAGAFEVPDSRLLSVLLGGTGSGRVFSQPVKIDCGTHSGSVCTAPFATDLDVSLSATADPGSVFAGWANACTGSGSCQPQMNQARTVTATFNTSATYALSVAIQGDGTGTVASTPSGITCSPQCVGNFASGSKVTLQATAAPNSAFIGWGGGGCSGTGSCVITLNANTNVTATFDATHFELGVDLLGSGEGSVTSNVSGIACPDDCSETYASGTQVVLTASAAGGSTFTGWSGACTGTSICFVVMSATRNVGATFALVDGNDIFASGFEN
jgi:hypothetical protein